MSSDDLTTMLPTEDPLHQLLLLLRSIDARLRSVEAKVDSQKQRFDSLDRKVDALGQRFNALEQRFNALEQRFDALEQRFDSLEQKVDARLHETRPIWENVLTRLEDIDTRLDRVAGTALTTRSELRELRREIKEHLPAMK